MRSRALTACAPPVACARPLRQGLALTIRAFEAAEIRALARPVAGDEKGHVRRLRERLLCQARGRAQGHKRNRRNKREELSLGHGRPPGLSGCAAISAPRIEI